MRIPKLCRNGDGRAFVTIPKSGGQREYLGTYGTPDAEKSYRQWVARFAVGAHTAPRTTLPTVGELALLYLNHADAYYVKHGQPSKEAKLVHDALKHLIALHASTPVNQFGPPELIQVQQFMVAGGYARKTINNHVSRCKRFIRWCCAMGHAPAELYHKLTTVDGLRKGRARDNPPIKPVPWRDVQDTLPFLPPTIQGLVQVQFFCGMRPQDAVKMQAEELDTTGDVWLYTPASHKTEHLGQTLVKAVPQVAQAILEPLLERGGYLFRPADSHAWQAEQRRANRTRTTPLYPSEAKRRKNKPSRRLNPHYTTDSYRRAVTYGLERAKVAGVEIPHWHPNQLRHAVATEISQKLGQQAAQRWLGHASLDTTSIYAERQLSELLQIATALDQHWG